nr:nicotinate phosphoribosyltransferase [uncultured Gellertiella sp.]
MNLENPILNTDSYKLSHHLQYPPDTRAISAYVEARGPSSWPEIVFFGLQMLLKDMLQRPVTRHDVQEAEEIATLHGLPFNREGWQRIVSRFGGFMPVRIEALPEGTLVRRGVPVAQITSTDPESPWVTAYLDTAIVRAIWYPSTVASLARRIREQLLPFYEKTVDPDRVAIATRLHDFGSRSATSREQSGIGGAAHLLFFERTDSLSALLYARQYYGAAMAGFSMPASEHATMTAWGQAREAEAFGTMLDRFQASGALSVVSDSYDIAHATAEVWGKALHERVAASGALLLVRPDSGDPIDTPVQTVAQLAYAFGTTLNSKGYKVINHRVRVMQGDGVSPQDMSMILGRMEALGFSADNIYFGIGSQLIQKVSRDTYAFTMKVNARQDGTGRWHDLAKRPATMQEKASKSGRQAVVVELAELAACRLDDIGLRQNHLVPVFENGNLLVDWTLDEIRARIRRTDR